MEKSRLDDSKKHQEFFKTEKGKDDYINKLKEIKRSVRENNLASQKDKHSKSDYVNNGHFLQGSVSKHIFIKKNIDELFPRKEKPVFKTLGEQKENKFTLNSSK